MSSRTKIALAAVGIIVLLGAAYFIFFNHANDATTAVEATGGPASTAEVTFLNLVGKINPITFDTTIFTDPRFAALVDIHTVILPEASGRKDPFAPVAGISSGNGK